MEPRPNECSICEGSGFYRVDVPFEDPRFGKVILCECKAQEDAARLQRKSGLTENEKSIRLEKVYIINRRGTAEMVQACAEFLEGPNQMLTIWGSSGNAKTMALQAVVNECLAKGLQAVYVTSFDLIAYIRSAFDHEKKVIDDNAFSRLREFEEVPVLALDEFDKVRATDWVQEQLTDLIDRRYRLALDGQAGTLIAMNSNPNLQPDWIYSRLSDARNRIVYNQDNDLRPLLK